MDQNVLVVKISKRGTLFIQLNKAQSQALRVNIWTLGLMLISQGMKIHWFLPMLSGEIQHCQNNGFNSADYIFDCAQSFSKSQNMCDSQGMPDRAHTHPYTLSVLVSLSLSEPPPTHTHKHTLSESYLRINSIKARKTHILFTCFLCSSSFANKPVMCTFMFPAYI